MGMTYDVTVKLKYAKKDEEKIINSIREFVATYSNAIFDVKENSFETIDNVMKVIITDRCFDSEHKKYVHWFSSGFDASYGWEAVMITCFEHIAPLLRDRSKIWIYPDSGSDILEVKDGKAIWIKEDEE